MKEECTCKECQDKKKYKQEGINIAERIFEEEIKGKMYGLGIPKEKMKSVFEKARQEVG